MARIMLVDDEENILKALRRVLSTVMDDSLTDPAHQIEIFNSPTAALVRAGEGVVFDIVISDYRMPEMDGVKFLINFKEIQPGTVRFILSGYADFEGLVNAVNQAHIHRFIAKPWDDHALRVDIRHALKLQELQTENQRLADQVRQQQGVISKQDLELRRLEAETPGITRVKRTSDGSVLLEDYED